MLSCQKLLFNYSFKDISFIALLIIMNCDVDFNYMTDLHFHTLISSAIFSVSKPSKLPLWCTLPDLTQFQAIWLLIYTCVEQDFGPMRFYHWWQNATEIETKRQKKCSVARYLSRSLVRQHIRQHPNCKQTSQVIHLKHST